MTNFYRFYQDEAKNARLKAFGDLKGETITGIEGGKVNDDEVIFTLATGERYGLYHEQDCCEHVQIVDVAGDWEKVIGEAVLLAEEVALERDSDPPDYVPEFTTSYDGSVVPDRYRESFSWTFYKLRTMHGYVVLRWLGESNGYYGEGVDFGLVMEEAVI